MTKLRATRIAGTGSYVPEKVLTNEDLARRVNTSDDWIVTRTGIRERRIAADDQASSDLATQAARRALEAADVAPDDIELVILCTTTPDYFLPNTACVVARNIEAVNAGAMDLNVACSGFVYALATGRQFVATGTYENVLVVGAEAYSRFVDWDDRQTCVLFGDGAGAVVIQPDEDNGSDILDIHLGARGNEEALVIPAGGSRRPASRETVERKLHLTHMNGRETFKFAIRTFTRMVKDILEKHDLTVDEIDLVVPHQVNSRIIKLALEKLGLPQERIFVNIDRYGNTASASIPLALDEAVREERLERGDLCVIIGFGGGLSWGSILFRY